MKLLAMKHRIIGLFAVFLPLALLGALVPSGKETTDTRKASVPAITTPVLTAPATRLTEPKSATPAPAQATVPGPAVKITVHGDAA